MAAISGNRKSATFIDMTPMVDLAFLLLTFFVLTTTLTKGKVLQLDMPNKVVDNPPPINAKNVLTLVLGPHDKIYWYMGVAKGQAEATNFSSNGVRKILMEKKISIPKLHILIKPSTKSQYKNMVDLLDEFLIVEIERYSIVDMEPEDMKLFELN